MRIDAIVAGARHLGKKVALHAGERDPLDVDDALALDPDLLITAPMQQKNSFVNVRTGRFRLLSVPDPTGRLVLHHPRNTLL